MSLVGRAWREQNARGDSLCIKATYGRAHGAVSRLCTSRWDSEHMNIKKSTTHRRCGVFGRRGDIENVADGVHNDDSTSPVRGLVAGR